MNFKMTMCGGMLFIGCAAVAATLTWSGAGDGTSWSDSANWGGSTPAAGDTLQFNDSYNFSSDIALPGGVTISVAKSKNVKLTGVVSGTGGITKAGDGSLSLNGTANTYDGPTVVSRGSLYFNSIANIGEPSSLGCPSSAANATITINADLYLNNQKNIAYVTDRPIVWGGGALRLGTNADKISGSLVLNGPVSGNNISFRGFLPVHITQPISGSTSVSRTDSGAIYLDATNSTFSGRILISHGSMHVKSIQPMGGTSSFGQASRFECGQLNWNTTGTICYEGTTDALMDSPLTICAFTNSTLSANRFGCVLSNGTEGVKFTYTGTITESRRTAYAASAAYLYLDGPGDGEVTSVLPGRVSVVKNGTGTWTLSGENTSVGIVEVASGRLDVNGTVIETCDLDAKVTVKANATLGGTGVVYGATSVAANGILSPGTADAIGALSFGSAGLSIGSGAKLCARIGASTNDCVNVDGTVDVAGDVTVSVSAYGLEAIPSGVYTLMRWTACINRTFMLADGAPDGSYLRVDGEGLALVVPSSDARTLTWAGTSESPSWDASSENWLAGGAAASFAAGDFTVFADADGVSPYVNMAADVAPGAVTLTADETDYVFDGAGAISSDGYLEKTGGGALTISNAIRFASGIHAATGTITLAGSMADTSFLLENGATFEQLSGSVISGENLSIKFGSPSGTHRLRGSNTFTGDVVYDTRGSGEASDRHLELHSSGALGHATNITVYGFNVNNNHGAFLSLPGGTVISNTTFTFGYTPYYRAYFYKVSGGTSGWYGDVIGRTGPTQYIRGDTGTFNLGNPDGSNVIELSGSFSFRGNGTINVYSRLDVNGNIGRDDAGTVVLFNPSNSFGGALTDGSGERSATWVQGWYKMGAPGAWPSDVRMLFGKNTSGTLTTGFDLNGIDVSVPCLTENYTNRASSTYHRYIKTPDGAPATFTVSNDFANATWGSPYSHIQGPLTLVKKGSRKFTLNSTENTFTGPTVVDGGTLVAAEAGSLGGTTNVVLQSGTLEIASGGAVNTSADVLFPDGATGVIQLDDGVEQRVRYMMFGDKVKRSGTWGSSSSAARNVDDTRFSGPGVLIVTKDTAGTCVFVR